MCGCSTQSQPNQVAERDPNALVFQVADMTCGHCAGAITRAVEGGVPGAKVEANPASKIVLVRGTSDLAKVQSLIADAGYTPTAA
jgi:copper chaperone